MFYFLAVIRRNRSPWTSVCMCAMLVERGRGGGGASDAPNPRWAIVMKEDCSEIESLYGLMCAFPIINAVQIYLRIQRASLLVCSSTTNNSRRSVGRSVILLLVSYVLDHASVCQGGKVCG